MPLVINRVITFQIP